MFSKKGNCSRCKGSVKRDFDFCPYCGSDMRNPERDLEEFGLLGKNEFNQAPLVGGGSLGFSDKIFMSIFNSLTRSLEKQFKEVAREQNTEVQHSPNGVTIRVHSHKQPAKPKRRSVSEEQVKRMADLPRTEAKKDVRRFTDKIVYELKTPDVSSLDDVFVSKVESGYEVKAIGAKKVYVNSLSVDLPMMNFGLSENGIVFEFALQ